MCREWGSPQKISDTLRATAGNVFSRFAFFIIILLNFSAHYDVYIIHRQYAKLLQISGINSLLIITN